MKSNSNAELQVLSPETAEQSEFNQQVERGSYTSEIVRVGFWANFFDFVKYVTSLILGIGVVIIVHPFGWIGMVIAAVIWKFIIT